MSVSFRLAQADDIPEALKLCRISGWNQLADDWNRLIEYEPLGCFVAESDGTLVGTVTTTRYGKDLAWIGMMLVHPEYRRKGIATELMNRSLQYLRVQDVHCIKLDATPDGQHVYERLGFTPEWSMRRWMRRGSDPTLARDDERSCLQMDPSDIRPYRELDRMAFGVDRWDWVLRLLADSDVRCQPAALGMLRRGYLANYLGPVIASDLTSAHQVIDDLIHRRSEPVFWDIPDPNRAAIALAEKLQFEPVRDLTRMWTGTGLIQSNLDLLFALADPSTG